MANEPKNLNDSAQMDESSIKLEDTTKSPLKTPLIVNQVPKNIKGTQPLPYHYGSETYDVYRNPKNPFNDRILSAEINPLQISPEKIQSLFHQFEKNSPYTLEYPSNISAHRRRKVTSTVSNPASEANTENNPPLNWAKSSAEYLSLEKLKEDKHKLNGAIEGFFQHVMLRLKDDPNQISLIVNELVPLLVANKIRIRTYEAFKRLRSIDDLLYALDGICDDYEMENFELFCSALFTFYSLQ